MATQPKSAILRKELRAKIRDRIEQLHLKQTDAADKLGLTTAQMSRLSGDQDIFTLDRLVDAAVRIGLTVSLAATRPYR